MPGLDGEKKYIADCNAKFAHTPDDNPLTVLFMGIDGQQQVGDQS